MTKLVLLLTLLLCLPFPAAQATPERPHCYEIPVRQLAWRGLEFENKPDIHIGWLSQAYVFQDRRVLVSSYTGPNSQVFLCPEAAQALLTFLASQQESARLDPYSVASWEAGRLIIQGDIDTPRRSVNLSGQAAGELALFLEEYGYESAK